MKITQVAVDVLRVPVDHPYLAGGRTVDANWHVLARVTTSDGVEGIGYIVYPAPGSDDGHRPRRARAGRAPDRHERAGAGGGVGAAGPARRLGGPRRPAPLRAGAARHRGVGRQRQDARPAAAPAARRVSRSAADVRERRPLVQPVAGRAGGLGQGATSTHGFGAREAAAGPRGDAGAGSAARAGRARGRRPGRADHGRHQRELVADAARGAAAARCRTRASRGWRIRSTISTSPVSPTSGRQLEMPIAAGEHLYHLDAFRDAAGGARGRRADSRPGPGRRRDAVAEDRRARAGASRARVRPRGARDPGAPAGVDPQRPPWWSTCRARPASSRRCRRSSSGELVAPSGPGLGLELDDAAVRRHQVA